MIPNFLWYDEGLHYPQSTDFYYTALNYESSINDVHFFFSAANSLNSLITR